MVGKKILLAVVLTGTIISSCDNRAEPFVPGQEKPVKPDKPTVTDEKVYIPFDHRGVDNRPHIEKGTYTAKKIAELEKAFADSMNKKKTVRGRVAMAGIFVVHNLDRSIPYSFPIWNYTKPDINPEYKYCGIYMRKGLFLKPLTENGKTYDPWGWPYPVTDAVKNAWPHTKFPDTTFPNGFTCSQYVDWCLLNAGITMYGSEDLYSKWATQLRVFPGSKEVSLQQGSSTVRPGDLIGFPGHIALILGVVEDYVIYASSDGGGDAGWALSGVHWHAYNRKTVNYDTYQYKFIIQMAGVYND